MSQSPARPAAPLAAVSPVALAALVALALPATPLAAQSALPTVIHACYVPSTGTVYRIKAPGVPDSCGSSKVGGRVQEHVPFEWNQQGPPGPVGPQGPQGVQGPPGPAGAGGTAAPVLLFNQRNVPINTAAPLAVTQTCPDGKRIIDRGYLLLDASGEPLVLVGGVTVIGDVVSAPPTFSQGEPPPRGQSRTLMIVNPGPRVVEVRMQLTCATVE